MATHQARLLAPGHPLAGAGVIVTRPAGSAAAVRRRVRALGGECVVLPGSGLRAPDDPGRARALLTALRAADIVIFTSPAAVRFAWKLQPQLRFARTTSVFAPGGGSARALQRRGVAQAAFPSHRQDSEGLLDLPPLQHVRRRRIALIGAAGGRELLAPLLAARGARVQRIDVYRRTPPRLTRRHLDALRNAVAPRISLFSSAAALGHLRDALPRELFVRLAGDDCVASSARIAAAARGFGFERVHVAAGPAPAQLLAVACAVLSRHRL